MIENQHVVPEDSDINFSIHEHMQGNGLQLAYEGKFTKELTQSVIAMAERNFNSTEDDLGTQKKVFKIMVECLQNITKHAESHSDDGLDTRAIFLIGQNKSYWSIITGNYLFNDSISPLQTIMDKINSMDQVELKAYFKECLKKSRISVVGGAGLGFIDIARKSGEKMNYQFIQKDDNVSFFVFEAKIPKAKAESN